MYHFVAEEAPESLELDTDTQVPGQTCQYLKRFQIDAVRFLHTHLTKREFCILNDESGLGKSVTVVTLLGAVVKNKKCLLVVQNDDELVAGWQFHFSILTQLRVSIVCDGKDSTESPFDVYIAKWSTLNNIGELSKFSFDFVIIDNRGQLLSNTFCTAMLLKQYERNVNIVISSVDITSDLKLLHNVLRLGGHLERQYESFKAFEKKFKLPNTKEVANKKIDLEDYFRKREILVDYCKEFRMRRYRQQFEQSLPLVTPERFKISLELWRDVISNSEKSNICESLNGFDKGTEELFEQYSNKAKQEAQNTDKIGKTTVKPIKDKPPIERNSTLESFDPIDEPVIMSPLFFVSDSEEEEDQTKPVVKPIEILSDSYDVIEVVDLLSEHREVKSKCNDNKNDKKKENTKTSKSTVNAKNNKTKLPKEQLQLQTEDNTKKLRKLNAHKTHEKSESTPTTPSRPATRACSSKTDLKAKKTTASEPKKIVKGKATDKSPAKTPTTPADKPNKRQTKDPETSLETPRRATRAVKVVDTKSEEIKKSKLLNHKTKVSVPTQEPESPKTPIAKIVRCRVTNTPKGVHLRDTRGMQRMTRSAGKQPKNKYMLTSLALDIDKKSTPTSSKNKTKQKVIEKLSTPKTVNDQTKTKDNKSTNDKLTNTKQSKSKISKDTSKSTATNTKTTISSSQSSVISSSDYEEIQCGQKLSLESSTTSENENNKNAAKTQTNRDEFLIPATPASLRINSQFPLLPNSSFFTESEVIFVPSPAAGSKRNQDVILLSSEQDECSSQSNNSQSRRTRALKRKRTSTKSSTPTTSNITTFSELLAKQTTTHPKSPDLFSNYNGSDAGLTCMQALSQKPFDGFKIFGSEVKQFQQQNALTAANRKDAGKSKRERSCLDILEKMFEPRQKRNANTPATKSATKNLNILPTHPIRLTQTPTDVTTNKQKSQQHTSPMAEEDIFEITNNGTFGSVMRVHSNGNISPVSQLKSSTTTQHNKITNYLIGSTQAPTPAAATLLQAEEQQALEGTPSKRTQMSVARKSPKAMRSTTQATKLTKWFHKNRGNSNGNESAAEESTKNDTAEHTLPLKTKRSTVKRRRLELSFKN